MEKVLEIFHVQEDPDVPQHTLWIALDGDQFVFEEEAAEEIVTSLRMRARLGGLIAEDATDAELVPVIENWGNGYTGIRRVTSTQ